jgi:hypothetical protein
MELWHMQVPQNSIKAVGDYLSADGPFEGKNDDFDRSKTESRIMARTKVIGPSQ